MIIADTNIVAAFVIDSEQTPRVESLRTREKIWRAPALFRHEWLNVVTVYLYRKTMSRDEALRTYHRGMSLLEIDDSIPDPLQILNLHLMSGCASYDCQFVALAVDESSKLVTFDQQILKAFPAVAVPPESV